MQVGQGDLNLGLGSWALKACLVAGSPLTMVLLVTAYSKTAEQVSKFMLELINQPLPLVQWLLLCGREGQSLEHSGME